MKNKLIYLLVLIAFYSCKKEDDSAIPAPESSKGVYIINEGSFGNGNGSVSFLEYNTGNLTENFFQQQNQIPLGDVVMSMKIYQERGYIVVNNSQKIEVVNIDNFKSTGTITNLSSPRYFVPLNPAKGYVSDWNSNVIAVVDLNTFQIIKTIPAGSGPEQMAVVNDKLYVTNVGGFGSDSTVTVINTIADTVIKTITVGRNPNSIVSDKNGKLWVLCNGDIGADWVGGTADDIAGELILLNATTDTIEKSFVMTTVDHPMKLTMNSTGDKLYYLNGMSGFDGRIYVMNITDQILPAQPLADKIFYGLGVDPQTKNILGAYVPGFSQKGYIFRYTDSGLLIDSIKVGIAPSGFAFN